MIKYLIDDLIQVTGGNFGHSRLRVPANTARDTAFLVDTE